ncbi:MAG: hypothetical protein QOH04_1824 [Sphingomonadales bacterium]|jgi:hypothetical protein|nr:hypothetical protein [Sphingomonadales bacterium]
MRGGIKILSCICRGGGPPKAVGGLFGRKKPLHHATHGPPPPEIRGRSFK